MGYEDVTKDNEPYDLNDESTIEERKFNGKWRASLKLKDKKYENTVFHICAFNGHTFMWRRLMWHLRTILKAKNNQATDWEIELEAEWEVKCQVNRFGFTPFQLAAYANMTDMVKTILYEKRIRVWKWGGQVYSAYALNEIDDYFIDQKTTPGIPITNIILSEGHFELFNLQVLSDLLS